MDACVVHVPGHLWHKMRFCPKIIGQKKRIFLNTGYFSNPQKKCVRTLRTHFFGPPKRKRIRIFRRAKKHVFSEKKGVAPPSKFCGGTRDLLERPAAIFRPSFCRFVAPHGPRRLRRRALARCIAPEKKFSGRARHRQRATWGFVGASARFPHPHAGPCPSLQRWGQLAAPP